MIDNLVEFQSHLAHDLLLQELLVTWGNTRIIHVIMKHQLFLFTS